MKENCQIEYSVLPKYFWLYTTKERSHTRPMLPQNDDSGGWAVMILWQASLDHIGCGNFKWRIYLKMIKLLHTLFKFTIGGHEKSTLYQGLLKHYPRGYLKRITFPLLTTSWQYNLKLEMWWTNEVWRKDGHTVVLVEIII